MILEALREEELCTQEDVVRALKKRKVEAAQASVSRDIAELGLIKVGGRYHAPAEAQASAPDFPLRAWVKSVKAAGPNLVVLRSDPGSAQRIGLALDQLQLPQIAGTIAGDDTVFCACPTEADSRRLVAYLTERLRP